MKTLYLLITLTQNGAGDINASFVNTETFEQCQQKTQTVKSIFTASSIPVIESRCIKSDMKFSEFGHASTASKIRNFYLVQLDDKTLNISAMPDWRSCVEKTKLALKRGRVYCASSVQQLNNH